MARLNVIEVEGPSKRSRGMIVGLPGLAESARTLEVTATHWAARGFRVLLIDPRGHGESPRWTADLLDLHPGDVMVEEILAEIGPVRAAEPLVLFGHSAGGSVATAVAAALSIPPAGVVLEDPFWRLPVTAHQDREVAAAAVVTLERQKRLTDKERQAEVQALYPRWPADELLEWSRAKAQMDIALVRDGDVIPSTGWPTLLTTLRAAKVPVLILTGTVGIGNTAEHRAIARSLGAEVVVIDGASHFVRRDAREQFHQIADHFLDRVAP